MKRQLIALCISSLLVGTFIVFNMNQDVSVPTVEKFTEDTSTNVSKHEATVSEHENVDKDAKTSTGDTIKKNESKEEKQKEKVTGKSEFKTTSVSSESKKQDSKKESSTKSSNASSKSNNDVVKQPVEKPAESKQEPVVEPTPEPSRPSSACPGGVNPDVSCDVILDTNFYFEIYGSQSEADAAGMYYLDEVMYIGEIEITNYSVQPVYRNDHSIAYYGLNLWSNGNLVQ